MKSQNELTEKRAIVSVAKLKQEKIWTNWVWRTQNDKKTKRPLSKVNNPRTWITYEDALANQQQFGYGVGIMFATNSNGLALCGIDIDAHNVDENPLARQILEMFSDTYTERSPSGKGYHILFFSQLDRLPSAEEYKRLYYAKNTKLDVECYISGMTNRYFTFTGNQTSEGDCVTDKTETLLDFLNRFMLKSSPTRSKNKLTGGENAPIDVSERLSIAMQASNGGTFSALYNGSTEGYNSPSEAVQAFMDMLVFYFGDGGESLVRDVYMQSGLAVGKWAERDDIIATTLSNAFQRVSDRYTAPRKRKSNKLTGERAETSLRANVKPMLDYSLFEDFVEEHGYSIRYNQITHNFEFFGFDSGESTEHLAENVPTILRDELRKLYTHVSRLDVVDYITQYATRHKFNPVLDAIRATKWDGTDRVTQIYEIFKIPADTEEGIYSRMFIQKWLMQCVCGLFNNIKSPYSLDLILIFQGKQGIGKTRFFEMLALDSAYFGEGICLDPRDKDSVIQATSKWISELGEIGSTMRKDMDSVKAFLTKSTDEYRTPYGRASLHYPRMTSFVGTVNDNKFLIDETGNRRFVTIPLSPDLVIDYDTQIKPFNALQLWSQVLHIVEEDCRVLNRSKSSCFRLNEHEKQVLEKRNSEFIKPLKGEREVLDILAEQQRQEQGYICTLREMTVTEFIRINGIKYDARTVGKVLKKYGYEPQKKRLNGIPSQVIKLPYKKYQGSNDN